MTPPGCNTPIPAEWALAFADSLADYMVNLFTRNILPNSTAACEPIVLPKVDLETLCEADRMVGKIVSAYKNNIQLEDVDMIRLAEQVRRRYGNPLEIIRPDGVSDRMDEGVPLRELTEPAVVSDLSGNVLLWYLPDAISQPNQRLMWEKLEPMSDVLGGSITTTGAQNWRTAPAFFREDAALKGAINISPVWFQQGRNTGTADPDVSALLKGGPAKSTVGHWLAESKDQLAILSGAMAIMHPDMYVTGREAFVRLGQWAASGARENILSALRLWPSVYSVASVMVNRSCPIHLDASGRPQWFDLLVSVGDHEELDMVLPSIGLRVRYNPGAAVAMSGQLLLHGVGPVQGNRGVISLYMRDNVHEHVNVPRCNMMHVDKVPGYT